MTKSAIPVSLQINREIWNDSFRIHGITELKSQSSPTGVFLNPRLDMLVIDSEDVEYASPQCLEDLARESGILEDIKCIAIYQVTDPVPVRLQLPGPAEAIKLHIWYIYGYNYLCWQKH